MRISSPAPSGGVFLLVVGGVDRSLTMIEAQMAGVISPELLEVLACPQCHGKLELVEEGESGGHLDCHSCRLRYKIDDGIPVMLIDEAEKF